MSRRLTLILAVILVLSLGASVALAQVPVINNPLVPGQKAPGSATFTLTVNGSGFLSDAVVKWNGTALTTTFVKSSQITASVPAADLVTAGTATVTVNNGSGPASNAAHFQVVKNGYTVAFSKLDYATDASPQDAVAADFNGDGKVDLAVATGNNTVSILIGNGTGNFPTHVQYAVPGDPVAIVLPTPMSDASFGEFRKQLAGIAQKRDHAALTFEFGKACAGVLQRFEFTAQLRGICVQLGDRQAMLAPELVQPGDLRIDFGKAVGIEFERVAIARKRVVGLAELDLRRVEQVAQ